MARFLSKRAPHLQERMDSPDADLAMLHRTYDQFITLNRIVAGWGALYRRFLRPRMLRHSRPWRLLDIGCGGGDIPRYLLHLAKRDTLDLQVTGIDPDDRAIDYLRQTPQPPGFTFRQVTIADATKQGDSFDGVISNHLLHHLDPAQLQALVDAMPRLCTGIAVHNDLRRSVLGYAAFSLIATPLFRHSFVVSDGLISLRRAYTIPELTTCLPAAWHCHPHFPGHLIAACSFDGFLS